MSAGNGAPSSAGGTVLSRVLSGVRRQPFLTGVVVLYIVALAADREGALEALATGARVFVSVALIILSVFGLLGLFQVWVDKKKVAARLGEGSGLRTVVLGAAFGTVLAGPVYVVFPLLKSVRDHGARWAVITAILAAWAVKIPMIPLEVRFLGWGFALTRSALTAVGAVVMGLLVERLMAIGRPRAGKRHTPAPDPGVLAAKETDGGEAYVSDST